MNILTAKVERHDWPDTTFGPGSVALELPLPPGEWAVLWSGEIHCEVPDLVSQVRPSVVGDTLGDWGRSNVSLDLAPGEERSQGIFWLGDSLLQRTPRLKVGEYQKGSGAALIHGCIHALEIPPGVLRARDWDLDTGVGSDTATTRSVPAGTTETGVRHLVLGDAPPGRYLIGMTCEAAPNADAGDVLIQAFGAIGPPLLERRVAGLPGQEDRIVSKAQTAIVEHPGGDFTLDLAVTATPAAAARIRRHGVFAVNWDQLDPGNTVLA